MQVVNIPYMLAGDYLTYLHTLYRNLQSQTCSVPTLVSAIVTGF